MPPPCARVPLCLLGLLSLSCSTPLPIDPLDVTPAAPSSCSASWGPDSCAFGSHMVLASNARYSGGASPARVWGSAAPHEVITLSGLPAGAVVSPPSPFTADASGAWSIIISTYASPTPVNLTFVGASTDRHSVTLVDVVFGLTILCSGQSNMDMNIASCFYANETLGNKASYPELRIKLTPRGAWARSSDVDNKTLAAFSAVCYYTAMHMKNLIPALADVPIGLVQSSVGGTVIESWMDEGALIAAGYPPAAASCNVSSCSGQTNCRNFDALIAPLAPLSFHAMVWYQGESNVDCNAAATPSWLNGSYSRLLPSLVSSWRALFQSTFTALIMQLAPYGSEDASSEERSGDPLPTLRAAQGSVLNLSHTGVVIPLDLGDDGKTVYTPPSPRHGGLHPRNKTEFGRRAALKWGEIEGLLPRAILPDGPIPTSALPDGDGGKIIFAQSAGTGALFLAPASDCATLHNLPAGACCQTVLTGGANPGAHGFPFEVLVDSGWVLANATVLRGAGPEGTDALHVEPLVPAGGAPVSGVRYGWQAAPPCLLVNEAALPMAPLSWRVAR